MVIGNTRSGRSIRRRDSGGSTGFVPDAPPLLLVLLALALGLAGCQPYTFHGTLLEPPLEAQDFALTNQDGQAARVSDFRGSFVLLFFGYTQCPDACPATLAQFKQIRGELGGKADSVRFVMVTVDPARDTPERLKEYLAQFDPSFIGLTGSADALQPVYSAYWVSVEAIMADEADADTHAHVEAAGTQAAVAVAHTSSVFLIDAEGRLRLIYTDIPWQDMAADIRQVLQ